MRSRVEKALGEEESWKGVSTAVRQWHVPMQICGSG